MIEFSEKRRELVKQVEDFIYECYQMKDRRGLRVRVGRKYVENVVEACEDLIDRCEAVSTCEPWPVSEKVVADLAEKLKQERLNNKDIKILIPEGP